MVFLFSTSVFSGTLIGHSDEGDVFWVKKDDLLTLDLAEGFDKNVEVMLNPALNELRIYDNPDKSDEIHILQ